MNKKILSIFLLALLVVSFAVPAYADSEEANSIEIPQTDPQVQAVNEAIERLDLSAADISEETVIEALEAEGISASADIFAYVYDFAGLEAALADPGVSIILLLADIQMDYTLTIDRDISMSGVMGSTIKSASQPDIRHFNISGSLSITFSNTVLDGGTVSGGINWDNCDGMTLKGAVIRNCYTSNDGGALRLEQWSIADVLDAISPSKAIIESCILTNNFAEGYGGGLYQGYVDSTVKDCEISRNQAGSGGGLQGNGFILQNTTVTANCASNSGGGISYQNLSLYDSIISENSASNEGGGVFSYTGMITNSSNSQIINNEASYGGGIYVSSYNSVTLNMEGLFVSGNTAQYGGGIYLINPYTNWFHTISVNGGAISENSAEAGGGVYIGKGVKVNLSGTELSKNTAINNGGAVYIGDLDFLTANEDVIFSGNTADKGYYMTDEADIAIHDINVLTTHFSEPFTQYAYNNFDISYEKGEELATVTASFYLRYSDTEPYAAVSVYAGQTLGDRLPEGPEQTGLRFIGWTDINGVIYNSDTVITENVSLYPAYILE